MAVCDEKKRERQGSESEVTDARHVVSAAGTSGCGRLLDCYVCEEMMDVLAVLVGEE